MQDCPVKLYSRRAEHVFSNVLILFHSKSSKDLLTNVTQENAYIQGYTHVVKLIKPDSCAVLVLNQPPFSLPVPHDAGETLATCIVRILSVAGL